MDEAMLKSGQFPNVAIPAGSDADEVMERYGVEGPTLRTAAYRHERLLRAMWRDMDVARLRGHLPDDLVDGWREKLESEGVSVE